MSILSVKVPNSKPSNKISSLNMASKFKKTLFFIFLSVISQQTIAQKFGYIDTEYITSKMPAYGDAMKAMNEYSDQWIKDIQSKNQELEKMRLDYQKEEILLTEDMKKNRLMVLESKERELREMNNLIFGLNGQLFQKKKEIMKPIMEAVFKACEKVARDKKLMFIFDKASDMSMVYTDPRHDYTDYVLEELGLTEKK